MEAALITAAGITGSDPNNLLTLSVTTGPTHGTITGFNATTGAYTYTANAGYTGADSFVYTVNDGHGLTTTGTVNITVENDNVITAQNVIVYDGLGHTPFSGALHVTGSDVNNTLSYALTTGPAHGSVSINAATGTYIYTPTGVLTSDSFTYTVSDGHGLSSTETVSLTNSSIYNAANTLTSYNYSFINTSSFTMDPTPDVNGSQTLELDNMTNVYFGAAHYSVLLSNSATVTGAA